MKLKIQKLLKNPKGVSDILHARKIDELTKFITDRAISEKSNTYSKTFIKNSADILNNKESQDKFISNLKFPLQINGFSDKIYNRLRKIWNGQNRSISTVPNIEVNIDFYFYKNELFEYYYKLPNTLVLVYTNNQNNQVKKFIKSSQIVSFAKNGNQFTHVLFKESGEYFYFDEKTIAQFEYSNASISEYSQQENKSNSVDIFHVSAESFNLDSDFVKTNRLGSYLQELVYLQLIYIYSKITSPYAFFLIIEKYAPSYCNYQDTENQIKCTGGYMWTIVENGDPQAIVDSNNSHAKCPKCNQSIAPGSVIKKDQVMAIGKADEVIDGMLSFIAPPVDSLQYADDYILRFENQLENKICGVHSKLNENQNNNATSVINSRSGEENVLINLKTEFQPIISQIEKSALKQNGKEIQDLYVNLGTYFLVSDINALYIELESSVKFNPENKNKIKRRIVETENQTDYPEKKRALILLALYPDIDPLLLDFANEKQKRKQAMFNAFVNWYDNNIIAIGYDSELTLKDSIKSIDLQFEEYVKK